MFYLNSLLVGGKDKNFFFFKKNHRCIIPTILFVKLRMKIQIILLFLIFFLNSCIDRNDYIRDVYVNIEIPLNQPEFSELNAYRKFNFYFWGGKRYNYLPQ